MRRLDVPPGERLFARLYLGFNKPKRPILGMELAGEIETTGKNVKRFKQGDPVFASTFAVNFGGYAEYKCFPEDGMLATKPAAVSFEEAAAVPVGGATALRFLRKANVRRGQKVLIYGASGSVGSYAVQLATYMGAEVTAVCSTANLEWVRALGAGAVLDYTKEDFTRGSTAYDVIFDAVGKCSTQQAKRALNEKGIFLSVLASSGREKCEDLLHLIELIEAGRIKTVIDRRYPLEQMIEAHRHVQTGHKMGNVIIMVG